MKLPSAIAITLAAILAASGGESPAPFRPAEILGNMPVNSDRRCLGIALVAESLIDGEIDEAVNCENPAEVGRRIFENASGKAKLRYASRLCVEDGSVPIQSREALNNLSTVVADLYKQRHLALMATAEGRRKIVAAQSSVIRTARELDEILDADGDKLHAFMAVGIRQFPDLSEKPTYHVVLIGKSAGDKVVYDPNDPGSGIKCRLETTKDGLFVKWTCGYRDTGQITTQEYRIVPRETFFRLALAGE